MTKHNYKQNAYYLIYLIRCVLQNRIPAKEKLDKMNLSGVFAVAKAHSLAAIAAYALGSAGIHNSAFEEAKNKAIRKIIILDVERESVLNELEKAGIWYMPLKGAVLKDMYPQIGMREMADNDILFDANRSQAVKAIMEALGFTTEHFGGSNHDVYQKPPVCNFEMHNALFSYTGGEKLMEYYSDVKNRLEKDRGNRYGYHFTNEDFYIYITAHEYKHFSHGGTGLRNLVDRYVFLNHFADDLDMSYIKAELSKIELLNYEKKSHDFALKLYNGVKLDAEGKQFLDYYIFSGTYGTTENLVENRIKARGGGITSRIRYGLDRFIGPVSRHNPSYTVYAAQYPTFYKHKLLLPLLPFYRLIHGLKNSRKRIITEIRTLMKL